MIALPRLSSQRWVYLSDESQSYTPLYPHYEGNRCNTPSVLRSGDQKALDLTMTNLTALPIIILNTT